MDYVIYGNELSYFTRKLEAALRFYGLPHTLRPKSPDIAADIEQRAGTHQVPVLQTPENWMLADTTPIMAALDARVPARRMFPAGLEGLLVHVLEEYFDEWIARTMVHYRWHYPDSAAFAADRISGGHAETALRLREWGPRACRATGTDSDHQQRACEDEYRRLLQAMEVQLQQTPYLLGDRPTAVDCVVLGGLRAHTNMDPDPQEVVAAFPTVVDWCEREADDWDGSGSVAPFPNGTGFAHVVLGEMSATYAPWVLANRDAQAAGARAFHIDTYGEDVSYLSRPYPERSRRMILDRLTRQLSATEREQAVAWLREHDLEHCFTRP